MFKKDARKVAYFSMEIGLTSKIPTYSGGLGVLAGDMLKAAADVAFPMVGVTLLNKHGYFFQDIQDGKQTEKPVEWVVDDFLDPVDTKIELEIAKEKVVVGCWISLVTGLNGYLVPVIFLTTDLPENKGHFKEITDHLYGEGHEYRLQQEIVLGVGGVRMLDALGFNNLTKYHMNEGHSSFLVLELLKKLGDEALVRSKCIFTTHTPVPAGHDIFELKLVKKNLSNRLFDLIGDDVTDGAVLNMTLLALKNSGYINGVAKKHAEVSKEMFPDFPINSITNGVHARTWVSSHFAKVYDEHVPNWQKSPDVLRCISSLEKDDIWDAHYEAKKQIIDFANATTNAGLDYDNFTLGWARRFTSYKRPDLFLENISKLIDIAEKHGPIQIIYAGKAHPQDTEGKKLIQKIIEISKDLNDVVKMSYLQNYDMYLSKFMTSGVDVWLNTPMPPYEASGTSGMKCALNGIPQLSVLDGWWHEGCVENETGWSFSNSEELYNLLDKKVVNCYYNDKKTWTEIMRKTIMLNGSFFNAHRMITEYIKLAYTV